MQPRTLHDKLWDAHVVQVEPDGTSLIYIDRQLVHEVTSPQAFEGLKINGRKPWRLASLLATPDHNIPTADRDKGIADPVSRTQVETLDANCAEFGITEFGMNDPRQGIVHVIGPEQGFTQPGMTLVCGDSHTSTHGAFGALAFGIGTSEVEHVLATQCLWQKKARAMQVRVEGALKLGVTAKDIALAVIGQIGTAGGTGYAVEFTGTAIRGLSMEGRMTLCNMATEAGARAGMVAVDDKTLEYMRVNALLGVTKDGAGNEVFSAEDYYNAFKADCNVQRVVNPLKQAEEELAKFRNEHLELDMLAQQDADVAEIKRRAAEGDTEAQQTHASLIQFKRALVTRMKNIMRIRHEKAEKQAKKANKA